MARHAKFRDRVRSTRQRAKASPAQAQHEQTRPREAALLEVDREAPGDVLAELGLAGAGGGEGDER